MEIHLYALCILAGIAVAYLTGRRRYVARGGSAEDLEVLATWGVLAGILGARVYHVVTDHDLYFGPGRTWYHIFFIWQGGLGIWGAVAGGGLVVWLMCRRRGLSFALVADCLAPGILLAQGIGRLGNWFNQELFGRPTTLPWGLRIDPAHRPAGYLEATTFHPTFLYELLWNVAGAAFLLWADRRWRLGHGRLFCLYVVVYTAGRFWVERLRIDPVRHVGGWRLNSYTSLIVLVLAAVVLGWLSGHRPGGQPPARVEAAGASSDAAES